MSTPELRKKLIARIRATTDVKLLREVERMLKDAGKEIAVFVTTPEQKKAIAKGMSDLKKGRVRSAAKANKAVEKS
jgi:diacylglycerol kinase family enzyme